MENQEQLAEEFIEETKKKTHSIKPDDIEICVSTKDDGKDGDGKYCAIVMGLNKVAGAWCNTGIVIRDESATQAFSKALARATKKGWWK